MQLSDKDKEKEAISVRDLRNIVTWSQRTFADYFNIPVRTLQHWEIGERRPPRYIVIMMYRILCFEIPPFKEDFERYCIENNKDFT